MPADKPWHWVYGAAHNKSLHFSFFSGPTWLILNEDFLCGQQPSLQRTLLFWVDSSSPTPSGFLNRLKSSMARNKGWPHLML